MSVLVVGTDAQQETQALRTVNVFWALTGAGLRPFMLMRVPSMEGAVPVLANDRLWDESWLLFAESSCINCENTASGPVDGSSSSHTPASVQFQVETLTLKPCAVCTALGAAGFILGLYWMLSARYESTSESAALLMPSCKGFGPVRSKHSHPLVDGKAAAWDSAGPYHLMRVDVQCATYGWI